MYHCPVCKISLLDHGNFFSCSNPICISPIKEFPLIGDVPLLIPFGMDLCVFTALPVTKNINLGSKARVIPGIFIEFNSFLRRLLYGVNRITTNNYKVLSSFLVNNSTRVLIIGGGTIGGGASEFYRDCQCKHILLEAIDVYLSPHIKAVADAHYLPYKNNSFDIVVIQAVLEHVIDPQKVVDEISRVLNDDGVVYAETPFMQSVHEGPYDFFRCTGSGHRWLFRNFKEIYSGVHHGAFSSVLFILSHAISGLLRTRYAGILLRIIFSRLANILDYFVSTKYNNDVACGNYFIGSKISSSNVRNDASWIVSYYQGAQD